MARLRLNRTSVEHMGVMVLGIGLCVATTQTGVASGGYASMLHAMHNTLNKGVLFFLAGFVWRLYETNEIPKVRGLLSRHPFSGVLLLAGLCATCGLPPFGMFFSELGIVFAAAGAGRWIVLALFVPSGDRAGLPASRCGGPAAAPQPDPCRDGRRNRRR